MITGGNMEQIYHPYWQWEDYKAGMWRKVAPEERMVMLKRAIEFTGDHVRYGMYMQRVSKEWPTACEHNLTEVNQNRKAWIGHAACCMAINCPEDITREAWGYLTKTQQNQANKQAETAILLWEKANHYREGVMYAQAVFAF
jgi:hypothetical protein